MTPTGGVSQDAVRCLPRFFPAAAPRTLADGMSSGRRPAPFASKMLLPIGRRRSRSLHKHTVILKSASFPRSELDITGFLPSGGTAVAVAGVNRRVRHAALGLRRLRRTPGAPCAPRLRSSGNGPRVHTGGGGIPGRCDRIGGGFHWPAQSKMAGPDQAASNGQTSRNPAVAAALGHRLLAFLFRRLLTSQEPAARILMTAFRDQDIGAQVAAVGFARAVSGRPPLPPSPDAGVAPASVQYQST